VSDEYQNKEFYRSFIPKKEGITHQDYIEFMGKKVFFLILLLNSFVTYPMTASCFDMCQCGQHIQVFLLSLEV